MQRLHVLGEIAARPRLRGRVVELLERRIEVFALGLGDLARGDKLWLRARSIAS
jgi:hypothetical protein